MTRQQDIQIHEARFSAMRARREELIRKGRNRSRAEGYELDMIKDGLKDIKKHLKILRNVLTDETWNRMRANNEKRT